MEIAIASYSYNSGLIGNVIAFYYYRSENLPEVITCNTFTFKEVLPTLADNEVFCALFVCTYIINIRNGPSIVISITSKNAILDIKQLHTLYTACSCFCFINVPFVPYFRHIIFRPA
jgi:hypothetical protein